MFVCLSVHARRNFEGRLDSLRKSSAARLVCGILGHHPPTVFRAKENRVPKSTSWGMRMWQAWHGKERYFGDDLQRTGLLHCSFVQEAVKKDRKGPYPPNLDN